MKHTIFTPYRVCPLGAHVDHQLGQVTGFAIDRGVELEFDITEDGTFDLISKNYPGHIMFTLEDELEREMLWGDFLKAAIVALSTKYELRRGIKGVIEGTLPVGGLSSSAAVILTYLNAVCIANDIQITRPEIISNAIWAERNYIGVNVGKLDQSCEVYCRKNGLLFLDTLDDSNEIIPVSSNMNPFEIMIVFGGKERQLAGSAYNTRVDECKAAAYALQAYAGMDYGNYKDTYLRNVPIGVYLQYKDRLPENWRKRAEHFYGERQRVKDGIKAWKKGDIEEFGQLMFQSGRSSIELYETGSDNLRDLQDIFENTDGIYGGRFSGAGFNGSSIALINPDKKEEIADKVRKEYIKRHPNLEKDFAIYFVNTADGIKL